MGRIFMEQRFHWGVLIAVGWESQKAAIEFGNLVELEEKQKQIGTTLDTHIMVTPEYCRECGDPAVTAVGDIHNDPEPLCAACEELYQSSI